MLVPAIQWDAEQGARLPFEGDALTGRIPDRRRAAAIQYKNHFLEQVAHRREALAGRNFAHITVVRGARCLVIDEHSVAATSRPRLELDRAQARNVVRADDVEPLPAHPAQIRRVLLGREFLREFSRDDCVLAHVALLALRYRLATGVGNRTPCRISREWPRAARCRCD